MKFLNEHKLKISILWIILVIGFIGPYCISAKDDLLVILGVLSVGSLYWSIKNVIKNV